MGCLIDILLFTFGFRYYVHVYFRPGDLGFNPPGVQATTADSLPWICPEEPLLLAFAFSPPHSSDPILAGATKGTISLLFQFRPHAHYELINVQPES